MHRKYVSSNLINSVGYKADLKILEIEFNDGVVYQYINVPKRVFTKLMVADSHGEYFCKHINNKYKYVECY